MTGTSDQSHALQRAIAYLWKIPSNGICFRLHGLWSILQAPALPSRIILGYQGRIQVRHDQPWWSPKHRIYLRTNRSSQKEMQNMELTCNSRTSTESNPTQETWIGREKDSYAVKKIVEYENRPSATHYTVRWCDYWPQEDTIEPAEHTPLHLREVYCCRLRRIRQVPKYTKRQRRPNGKRSAPWKSSKQNEKYKKKHYLWQVLAFCCFSSFSISKEKAVLVGTRSMHLFFGRGGSYYVFT